MQANDMQAQDMQRKLGRRAMLRGALAFSAALGFRGANACEFVTGTLTVLHPWTRASVAGATTAVVGMSFQDVVQDDVLVDVQTPVAERAEMHVDGSGRAVNFPIPKARTTVLGETGVQLRLVGLKVPLLIGREYPMTLSFAKAGMVVTRLTVEYAHVS